MISSSTLFLSPPFSFHNDSWKNGAQPAAFRNSLAPIKLPVRAIVNLRRGRVTASPLAPFPPEIQRRFLPSFRGGINWDVTGWPAIRMVEGMERRFCFSNSFDRLLDFTFDF